MIERRSGTDRRMSPRARISQVEQALHAIRFLRPEILAYVREFGPPSAQYFERVIDLWYRGTLEQRAAFVAATAHDPAFARAWRIVHAAGEFAAPLIPYVVRRYYGRGIVDERA